MRFSDAVAQLDARSNYERSGRLTHPTLDRMRLLVDALGDPQASFQAVHITGTNGKTTAAYAATHLLRAAGLSVGTYTSPHVSSVTERVLFDGEPIPEDDFAEAWDELRAFLDLVDGRSERPVTWFEAMTALAFLWFADKAVDVAVVEVGMGGTWDATNVVDAEVAAITRIAVDHAAVLGDTPARIAVEKSGIVKPGSLLYTVEQDADVAEVLRARAAAVGAHPRVEPEAFALEDSRLALGGQSLTFRLGAERYEGIFLPMFGEHFARDAVLGAAAARSLLADAPLEPELVSEAFADVRVPGRMEIAHRSPLVLLDGAHNPAAARALAHALPASFSYDRLWLVAGMMDDKDARGILEPLVGLANDVLLAAADSPRAASAERLREVVRALGADAQIVPTVADAVSVALERAEDGDCILVSGSLYTVGEARSVLLRAAGSKENR